MIQKSPSGWACIHIAAWRREAGYRSQADLADAVQQLGVPMTRAAIATIEGQRREHLTVEELAAFAIALDVSPTDLIVGDDDDDLVDVAADAPDTSRSVREWVAGDFRLGSRPDAPEGEDRFRRKGPLRLQIKHRPAYWNHPLIAHLRTLEVHVRTLLLHVDGRPPKKMMQKEIAPLAAAIRSEAELVHTWADTMAHDLEVTSYNLELEAADRASKASRSGRGKR